MKKGLLQTLFISSIFLINLVSASFHYGYGRFSFRGFLDTFDPVTITLSILFVIFLLVLNNIVFINFFRGQKAPALVVSALISFLSVYWMYQKGYFLDEALIFPVLIAGAILGLVSLILVKGFRINKALSAIIALAISGIAGFITYDSGFGLSNDILYPIISFLLVLGIILLMWKKKFTWFLIISGILLMILSTTELFYEKGIVAFIGFVLLMIGLWLAWRNRKKRTLNLPKGVKPYMPFRWPRWLRGRRGPRWPRGPRRTGGKSGGAKGRGWTRADEEEAHQEDTRRRAEEEAYKEDAKRQQDEQIQKQKEVFVKRENKFALVRKLGIDRLTKQYQDLRQEFLDGQQRAGDLHTQSTKLGWTKSGRTNPRQGESEKQYKTRVKEANKTYKTWYRQYSKNITDEKRLKEIETRIQHLQSNI